MEYTAVPIRKPTEKHKPQNRLFQGIPSIAATLKGRLFAAWYGGGSGEGAENFVMIALSDDGGKNWSKPVAVIDPPQEKIRAYDSTFFVAPDGRLYLFWAQTESQKPWDNWDGHAGVWYSICADPDAPAEELSWTHPVRIGDGIMMNKPIVLANGEWALPLSIWNVNQERRPSADTGAKMFVSTDNGITFTERGSVHIPDELARFDEHSIYQLKDGSLGMLIRMKKGYFESFSKDGGFTWSEVVVSPIPGPDSRAYLGRLKSGRLLLVHNDSSSARRNMTARLSDDDGKTWSGKLVLDLREQTSYPDVTELPDGRICVIYDYARQNGGFILCSVFTEDDIPAGKLDSAGSSAANIISVLPHCL